MSLHSLCISLVLGISLVLSSGCSKATPTQSTTEPLSEKSTFASALPSSEFSSPLPTPVAPLGTPLPRDPTPEPGLGTVQGVLAIRGEPAAGYTMYLAPIVQTGDEGVGGVAALDPVRDPRAESDSSGYFVFVNVTPGRYALGISSPVGPVLIRRDENEITADVEADQIVDLEVVRIVPFTE